MYYKEKWLMAGAWLFLLALCVNMIMTVKTTDEKVFKRLAPLVAEELLESDNFREWINVITKEVLFMFDYMSVKEAAEKWGLSERRIQVLCATNRIHNVMRISHVWLIPRTAIKPKDGRFKKKMEEFYNE